MSDETKHHGKLMDAVIGILLALLIAWLMSCAKPPKQPEPEKPPVQKTCFDINLAKDVIWHPIYSGYSYPTLKNDGTYYESGQQIGTWTFSCDCVVVRSTTAGHNFFFKLAKLKADTMQVYSARFGVTLFYR